MDIRARFGGNVRALREKSGFSQDEFADMAKVHRTYMSGIERGKRAPTIKVVERIAIALNVDPGVLFAKVPGSTGDQDEPQ